MNTFILELEGKIAVRLASVESAGFNTNELSKPANPYSTIRPKITLNDIKIKFGADASRSLLDWVAGAGVYSRKNGAIIVLDARSVVVSRIDFMDATITSFVMPAVDRSSKAAAQFFASFRPQTVVYSAGGSKLAASAGVVPANKTWHASNFRFNIGGLPMPGTAVSKVSTFGLKTGIKERYIGRDVIPEIEPIRTSFSNIVITVPMSKATDLVSWAEETISGRSAQSEKNASLEYLGPADKMSYFTAEFTGLGMVSTSFSKTSDDSNKDVIAELYYDSVRLSSI